MTTTAPAALMEVLCELDTGRAGLPPELRQWKRTPAARRLYVYRIDPHQVGPQSIVPTTTRDISRGGVGLVARVAFRVGERFVLPVRFDEGGGRLFLCEVRYARNGPGGMWSVGAQFLASVEDKTGVRPVPAEWLPR